MQKRLLALVATVAMVLSMFAGVVFAAPGDVTGITVDSATIADDVLSGELAISFEGDVDSDQSANLAFALDGVALVGVVVETEDNVVYTFSYEAAGPYPNAYYELEVTIDTFDDTRAIDTRDFTAYNAAVAAVEAVDRDIYTDDSLVGLDGLDPVLTYTAADIAVTQTSLDDAVEAINLAIEGLVVVEEFVAYRTVKKNVEDAIADPVSYTEETYQAFLNALQPEYLTLDKNSPASSLIIYTAQLRSLYEALEAPAVVLNWVAYDAAYTAKLAGLTEQDYTEASWAALQAVLLDKADPAITQAEINAAVVAIQGVQLVQVEVFDAIVKLDDTEFVLGEKIKLTGKIVYAAGPDKGKTIDKKNFTLDIDEEIYATGADLLVPTEFFPGDIAFAGIIDLEIKPLPVREGRYTYEAPVCPGMYTLVVAHPDFNIKPVTFIIKDNVESDDALGFTWGSSMTKEFSYANRLPYGVELDRNNDSVRLVYVADAAKANPSFVEYAVVAGRAFYFDGFAREDFPHAGEIVVQYLVNGNWISLVEGEIATAKVGLTVTPNAVIYGSKTSVTFKMTTSSIYDAADVVWSYTIVDKDDEVLPLGLVKHNGTDARYTVDPVAADRNTAWTAKVVGRYNGEVCFEGEADFRVVRPDNYNLIGLAKEIELTQAGYEITPGEVINVTYYDSTAKDYLYADDFVITAKGAGITKFEWDSTEDDAPAVLLPKNGGVIEITVKAYKDGGEHIATFNDKITVKAGQITVEPATMARDKAQDVVVTLVDIDGKEVNNAYIFATQTSRANFDFEAAYANAKVNPEKVNIRGGVYTFKMTAAQIEDAGTWNIFAIVNDKGGQTWMAISSFKVLGDNVYDVSVDVEDLLAGQDTAAVITVEDEDGDYIKPTSVTINYGNNKSETISVGAASGKGYKITIPALDFAGEATIIASTDGGNFFGELDIEVYKPQLVIDVEKVTDRVNSEFSFKLVDPRSEEELVLDWDVAIKAEYAEYYTVQKWDYAGNALRKLMFEQDNYVQLLGSKDEHRMLFLLNADYFNAELDEETPQLVFVAKDDADVTLDTVVEIGKATLTPDPANPVAGRDSKVVFTLADANGNPMEGYKVYRAHFMDAAVGVTDENGQYEYVARMDGVESFAAELDYLEDADKKVYATVSAQIVPGYDTEAPEVTYEVNGSTATIIVTDNVTLVRVQIDGKDVDLWAGAKYEHKVALKPGLNKVVVKAQDSAGNLTEETLEIEAAAVVLQGDQVQRQGEYTFVQLRQFEELGAAIGWNQETKVASFVVGETKVEVTIGSVTAKVDGEAVTMPVAPFISNDRTYVPVRFVSESLGWSVHWTPGDVITISLP